MKRQHPHIVVIGAGVGGLSAAALLSQAGYRVTVLEAQTYPGGCAGTFYHKGFRFDAGATTAGGFQPNGPHTLIGEKLGIEWPVHARKSRGRCICRSDGLMLAMIAQTCCVIFRKARRFGTINRLLRT